jgi:hypothetical protein
MKRFVNTSSKEEEKEKPSKRNKKGILANPKRIHNSSTRG